MAIAGKIKAVLASIESLRKDLSSLDESHAEAEALTRVLDGKRGELNDLEQQIVRTKEAAAQADAEFERWREITGKQQKNGNARIDALQAELQTLEQQVAERRAEADSVLAGMESLARRLRAG